MPQSCGFLCIYLFPFTIYNAAGFPGLHIANKYSLGEHTCYVCIVCIYMCVYMYIKI